MTSAYPKQLDRLARQVAELAEHDGRIPSRNQVMKKFKVGGPKARAALDAVKAVRSTTPSTGTTLTVPEDTRPRLLHAVPTPDTTPTTRHDTGHDVTTEDVPTAEHATHGAPDAVPVGAAPDAHEDTDTTASAQPAVVLSSSQVSIAADLGIGSDTTSAAVQVANPPADRSPVVTGRVRRAWLVLTDRDTTPVRPVRRARQVRSWPVLLIALGAFVAIWGGWVELGKLTGFGEITPLPGIADGWTIDSAITLPLGVEAYAAFALRVWLSSTTRSRKARSFAKWSALGALLLGAGGQIAYHLMKAAGMAVAPWQITTVVSCLPVLVLGLGAALTHLMHDDDTAEEAQR
ncbi:ABC transporter permease [Umezawaea beigongshangensis]|uniref:ABC transporter permease n=1 Tax=Umezawaea beigongshangensis TaxID=2780383 RepID=UPI0018F239B2|nr:ABC transporter permease [Umezawaea beigongshangensis]